MPQGGGGPGGAPAPGGSYPYTYASALAQVSQDLTDIWTRLSKFQTVPGTYDNYQTLQNNHMVAARPDEWRPWKPSNLDPILGNLRDCLVYLMTCQNYFDSNSLAPGLANQSDWPAEFKTGAIPQGGYPPTLAFRMFTVEIAREIRLKNNANGNFYTPTNDTPDVGSDVPAGFFKSQRAAWYVLMIQAAIYFIATCNNKAPQSTSVTYSFPSDFLIKSDGTYQDPEAQLSYIHNALTTLRDMLWEANLMPNGHKF